MYRVELKLLLKHRFILDKKNINIYSIKKHKYVLGQTTLLYCYSSFSKKTISFFQSKKVANSTTAQNNPISFEILKNAEHIQTLFSVNYLSPSCQ